MFMVCVRCWGEGGRFANLHFNAASFSDALHDCGFAQQTIPQRDVLLPLIIGPQINLHDLSEIRASPAMHNSLSPTTAWVTILCKVAR